MKENALWQCPICQYMPEKPTQWCLRCGCHLLLLIKIRLEAKKELHKKNSLKSRVLYLKSRK